MCMSTSPATDPKLLDRAVRASGVKTKTAAVNLALRDLVAAKDWAEAPVNTSRLLSALWRPDRGRGTPIAFEWRGRCAAGR